MLSIPHDIPPQLAEMVRLQAEQLDVSLTRWGAGWHGEANNDTGAGFITLLPLSPYHAIMEHATCVKHPLALHEASPAPYACIGMCNAPSLACFGTTDLSMRPLRAGDTADAAPSDTAAPVAEAPDTRSFAAASLAPEIATLSFPALASPTPEVLASAPPCAEELFTFAQDEAAETVSMLDASTLYTSRSIIMLEGYFDDLQRRFGDSFASVFRALGDGVPDALTAPARASLMRVPLHKPCSTAEVLIAHSSVDAFVGELACVSRCEREAQREQGCGRAASLSRRAMRLMRQALDRGEQPGIDELAERLYVSRSRLCAAFKAETGEGVAAHMRRMRMERACELLDDSRSGVASVASALGYPSHAAFTQAFKQAYGVSPSAWREQHR